MIDHYFLKINELIKIIMNNEKEKMITAAEKVAESIINEGIIHLFGCGHSHILTEEVFYRAGGLVPISPIFHEPLMLHEGAVTSSVIERKNDYAESFMKEADIQKNDISFVLSTSGRNPVPADVAIHMKEKGVYVIGITSKEYSTSQPSRHKEGHYLYNSVDLYIDNHAPIGDALLEYDKVKVKFTPSSTIIGAFILNSIFAQAIKNIADKGYEPPIFLSGNLEGADQHNKRLIDKYSKRIKLLA